MSVFGAVLKDIRSTHGLSQHALAERLGSTQRHVSFVETGRSAPTDYFVTRLCRTLDLTLAQRANLFDAAGLPQIYLRRDMASDDVRATLDLMETRILAHWPFPAIVLDQAWNILRVNARFQAIFGPFLPDHNQSLNMLDLFQLPQIQKMVNNWSNVAEILYYRLQSAAARHAEAEKTFARAKAGGLFDALPRSLGETGQAPAIVPIRLTFPDGQTLEMTSLLGRLIAAHDCLVDGFEVEFFVPCDAVTEALLQRDQPK